MIDVGFLYAMIFNMNLDNYTAKAMDPVDKIMSQMGYQFTLKEI